MENLGKITIMTSEIEKGDTVLIHKGKYYISQSDAYKHEGIWSFDFDENYRYGFQSIDTEIEVNRK